MAEPDIDVAVVVRRNEEAMAERMVGETVVLDPDTDRYTRLNATGSRLWEALADGPTTAGALATTLADAFDIPKARARADVARYLRELERRELVTLEG
jgi:hypothetical protein